MTTHKANWDDATTRVCGSHGSCGYGELCVSGKCVERVTKVSIPHNLSYHILTTRVSEANIDTEGEPRRCNNINLWCPPHQFCYRSVCVSIGALSARADGEYLFTFGGYSAQLTLLPVSGLP